MDDPITISHADAVALVETLTYMEEMEYPRGREGIARDALRLRVMLDRLLTPPPARCEMCRVILSDEMELLEGVCLPCFLKREADLDKKYGPFPAGPWEDDLSF